MLGCFTPCAFTPPLLSTSNLPLTRTRKAPTVRSTCLECGTRNIHTPGILGDGWCWPGCHSIFETVGRQVCVTKVIFVCTDAELAKMSSIVCVAQVRHTLRARRKNRETIQQCFGASPAWLGCGRSSPGISEHFPTDLNVPLKKRIKKSQLHLSNQEQDLWTRFMVYCNISLPASQLCWCIFICAFTYKVPAFSP